MIDPAKIILRSVIPKDRKETATATASFAKLRASKVRFENNKDFAAIFESIGKLFRGHGKFPHYTSLKSRYTTDGEHSRVAVLDDIFTTSMPIVEDEFDAMLEAQDAIEAKFGLRNCLEDISTILESGKTIRTRHGKKELKGTADAANFMLDSAVSLMDRDSNVNTVYMSEAEEDLREEFDRRKANPEESIGILTGLETLDTMYRGILPGDLMLVAGFAGNGKSTMCFNIVHEAQIAGYNVLYFSLEETIDKCRRVLACIHASSSKFTSIHPPLQYSDIKTAELDSAAEQFYKGYVLPDLKNPDYGEVIFRTPAAILTLDDIMAQAELINRSIPIDLIVIDYINLVNSREFSDFKDSLNHLVKQMKQWAMSFDNGRGVPIISPFQINRRGYDDARKNEGVYEVTSLSHASEAERSADLIIAIYAPDDRRALNEAKITCLKARDSGAPPPMTIYADFSRKIFAEMATEEESLWDLEI